MPIKTKLGERKTGFEEEKKEAVPAVTADTWKVTAPIKAKTEQTKKKTEQQRTVQPQVQEAEQQSERQQVSDFIYTPSVGGSGRVHYGLNFEASKQGDGFINTNSPFAGYAITSKTGARNTGIAGASKNHAGIDRAMAEGTPIALPMDVTYIGAGYDKARGNWIELKDANGNILHYQHLKDYGRFIPGQVIKSGQTVARSGKSGVGTAHLHEEYYSPSGVNITESYWAKYASGGGSVTAQGAYTPSAGVPAEISAPKKQEAGQAWSSVRDRIISEATPDAMKAVMSNATPFETYQMLKAAGQKERELVYERVKKRQEAEQQAEQKKGLTKNSIAMGVTGAARNIYNMLDLAAGQAQTLADIDAQIYNMAARGLNKILPDKMKLTETPGGVSMAADALRSELVTTLADAERAKNNYYTARVQQNINSKNTDAGKYAAQAWSELLNNGVRMLPTIALGIMSGGTTQAAALGTQGTAAAEYISGLVKNPMFWETYMQTAGASYEEAKQSGATEQQAQTAGTIVGFLNSAIELGGGVETEIATPAGGRSLARRIVQAFTKTAPEEALEEGLQDLTENLVNKFVYKHDAPLYSTDDENAVYNPARTGKNMAAGYVLGGVMGAGNAVLSDAARTAEIYSKSGITEAIGKLGYQIKYTDDASVDGMVDKDTKTLYVNRASKSPWNVIAKHEISHIIEEGGKYKDFTDMLKADMPEAWRAAGERVTRRYERANEARAKRGEAPFELDKDTLEAETAAEISEALKLERFIRNFAVDNKPFAMKMIEFSRSAAQSLREKMGTDRGWGRAANLWAQALRDAKTDTAGNGRHRIAYTVSGEPVAVIEKDILNGVAEADIAKTIKNELKKFRNGIPVHNSLIRVNARTGREFTYSKYTRGIKRTNDVVYKDKMRTSANMDDVINASTNYINSRPAHQRKDNFKQFAKGDVLLRIGNNDYSAKVIVGITDQNNTELYDIIDFTPVNLSIKNKPTTKQLIKDETSYDETPYAADSDRLVNDTIAQNVPPVNSNIRKSNKNDTQRNKIAEPDATAERVKRDILRSSETTPERETAQDKPLPQSDFRYGVVKKVRGADVKFVQRATEDGKTAVVPQFERPTPLQMETDEYNEMILHTVNRFSSGKEDAAGGKIPSVPLEYQTKDMRRTLEDFFGKNYDTVKKAVIEPMEKQKLIWQYLTEYYSNRVYDEIIVGCGISKGSRMSAMLQLYGEGKTEELAKYRPTAEEKARLEKADAIWSELRESMYQAINETREIIYPGVEEKRKKLEQQRELIKNELEALTLGFSDGDFTKSDFGAGMARRAYALAVRIDAKEKLAEQIKSNGEKALAEINKKIEEKKQALLQLKRKDTKKYTDMTDSLDRMYERRATLKSYIEMNADKTKAVVERLEKLYSESVDDFQEKINKRIARLIERGQNIEKELSSDYMVFGKKLGHLDNYYMHMQESDGVLSDFYQHMRKNGVGKTLLETVTEFSKEREKEVNAAISNALAGKSAYSKPKSRWLTFEQHRRGDKTKLDAIEGMRNYIPQATWSMALDPCIAMWRKLGSDLAEGSETDANRLGEMIDYINEQANVLAGKSTGLDRFMMDKVIGRAKMKKFVQATNFIKGSLLSFNLSSAVVQMSNLPNVTSSVIEKPQDARYFVSGIYDLVKNAFNGGENDPARQSSFLNERYNDFFSRFDKGAAAKLEHASNFMLSVLDEAVTRYGWYAAYRKAQAAGHKSPVKYADDLIGKAVGNRGIGEKSHAQNSKFFNMIIPFSLEVRNSTLYLKNTAKRAMNFKEPKEALKGIYQLMVLFITGWASEKLLSKIKGSGAGLFNPIQVAENAVKDKKSVPEFFGELVGNYIGSTMTGQWTAEMYPEQGKSLFGGKVQLPTREQLFGDENPARYGSGNLLTTAINNFPFIFPGGNQAKKSTEALIDLMRGYAVSRSGKKMYDVARTPENVVKGLLFGKSAFAERDAYFNPQEVKLKTEAEGFKHSKTSRSITVSDGLESKSVELKGDDLQEFEQNRLEAYESMYNKLTTGQSTVKNPYGTDDVQERKKRNSDTTRFKNLVYALYKQGAISRDECAKLVSQYARGEEVAVSGVEYIAPVKVKREKKFSELTKLQQADYRKALTTLVKSGKISRDRALAQLKPDAMVTVSEYITGSLDSLGSEEREKIFQKMNTLATQKAEEEWQKKGE